jgi:predicted dehydrogenase
MSSYADAPIRVDLVGCGEVVQRFHAPLIARLGRDKVRVRACLDLNLVNARKVAEITSAQEYGSPRSIQASDPIDGALIATPPDSHADLAYDYLSAGKHVFVEKPVTTHGDDLHRIINLSHRHGRRVIVDQLRRFFPSTLIARKLISRGFLGRILHVEATEGFRWDWLVSSKYVVDSPYGGVLYDNGANLVDMLLFILSLDEDADATTFSAKSVEKSPTTEPSHHCRFVLEFESRRHGAFDATVALSRIQPLAKGLKVWGEEGMLIVPTGFSDSPIIRAFGTTFSILEQDGPAGTAGIWDCFLRAHEEFGAICRDPTSETILDACRFVLLTRILEDVWSCAPS